MTFVLCEECEARKIAHRIELRNKASRTRYAINSAKSLATSKKYYEANKARILARAKERRDQLS